MLKKIGSDARVMADAIASYPYETKRALVIVGASLVVIGAFLFWPDIPATLGFSVVTILLMLALMAMSSFWDNMEPADGSWDDGWGVGDGDDELDD